MDRVYEITSGFSEGFYTGMTTEEKSQKLEECGLIFMYQPDLNRRVFYMPIDTEESKSIEDEIGSLLKPVSMDEFNDALKDCHMAIGLVKKNV